MHPCCCCTGSSAMMTTQTRAHIPTIYRVKNTINAQLLLKTPKPAGASESLLSHAVQNLPPPTHRYRYNFLVVFLLVRHEFDHSTLSCVAPTYIEIPMLWRLIIMTLLPLSRRSTSAALRQLADPLPSAVQLL